MMETQKSNDGCGSTCAKIEDLYICYGGTETTIDKCETCPPDYEPNSDKSKCVPKSISSNAKTFGLIYISFVFGAGLLNFLTSITSIATHKSVFDMVNQAQLFIMLPCIGMYSSETFIEFNRVIKDGLVSFSYISNSLMPSMIKSLNDSDYSQRYSYLYLVDLKSGSSLYNISGLLLMSWILFLMHLTIWIINDLSLKEISPTGFLKMSHRLVNYLSFGIYIRWILLSFMFLLISSIPEVANSSTLSSHRSSYYFACIVVALCVIFFTVFVILKCLFFTKDGEIENTTYCKELFRGFKQNRISRVYYGVFLLRRLLFIFIIYSTDSLSAKVKLIAIITFQVLYLIYLAISRPSLAIKDNISDILNEITILAIMGVMAYYIGGSDWSNTASNSVIGIIMINICVHVIISAVGFVVGLASGLNEKKGIVQEPKPIQTELDSPRKKFTEVQSPRKFGSSEIYRGFEETKDDLARSPTKKDTMETFSILKPMKMQDFKKKNYEVY